MIAQCPHLSPQNMTVCSCLIWQCQCLRVGWKDTSRGYEDQPGPCFYPCHCVWDVPCWITADEFLMPRHSGQADKPLCAIQPVPGRLWSPSQTYLLILPSAFQSEHMTPTPTLAPFLLLILPGVSAFFTSESATATQCPP
jgi:hypothetical protein